MKNTTPSLLFVAMLLLVSVTQAAQIQCPNLEGIYSIDLQKVKKSLVHPDEVQAETCQYRSDASTALNPSMKAWINSPDADKTAAKTYSYVFKKSANNNCEYFILNSAKLMTMATVKKQFSSGGSFENSWWSGLDLNDYKQVAAKIFAINPEGHVEREATVQYGGIYAELDIRDLIEQKNNGDILAYRKNKSAGVIYVVPMIFHKESACLFKKLQ